MIMTIEQQRIAIAEECEWERLPDSMCVEPTWRPKGWVYGQDSYGNLKTLQELPDYPNDLNAMSEAEKTLKPDETAKYENFLALAVFSKDKDEYWVGGIKHIQAYCFHAEAPQRAEAWLRTKGKWID